MTNLPGVTPMKPGSCTLPFYGIDLVVLDPQTGKVRFILLFVSFSFYVCQFFRK